MKGDVVARPARTVVLAVLLAGGLAGCGAVAPARPGLAALPGETLVRTELLFGRARPDGATVSDAQWAAFVDEHVTPRFPDGLTVLEARGQYRTRAGQLVREPSMLMILLHDGGERSRAAIEEIRTIYKRLFDQESVLLISAPARVSF
jgi:hypothetical protein